MTRRSLTLCSAGRTAGRCWLPCPGLPRPPSRGCGSPGPHPGAVAEALRAVHGGARSGQEPRSGPRSGRTRPGPGLAVGWAGPGSAAGRGAVLRRPSSIFKSQCRGGSSTGASEPPPLAPPIIKVRLGPPGAEGLALRTASWHRLHPAYRPVLAAPGVSEWMAGEENLGETPFVFWAPPSETQILSP